MTLCPHCRNSNVADTIQRGIQACADCGAEFRDDVTFTEGSYRTFMTNVLNTIAENLQPAPASVVVNIRNNVLEDKNDIQSIIEKLMDLAESVDQGNILGHDRRDDVVSIIEGVEKITSYGKVLAKREEITDHTAYRLAILEGSDPSTWMNPPGEIPDLPGEIGDEAPPSTQDIVTASNETPDAQKLVDYVMENPELQSSVEQSFEEVGGATTMLSSIAQQIGVAPEAAEQASDMLKTHLGWDKVWQEATWLGEKVKVCVEECGDTAKYNVKGSKGSMISYNEETGQHDGIENFTEEQLAELDGIISEFNKDVMDSMKKSYGAEKANSVYYATANKQNRNPENFEQKEDTMQQGIQGPITSTETDDPAAQAEQLSQPMMADEGVKSTSDDNAANELALYVANDGELYRRQGQPIEKNLQKKIKRGVYDHDLAAKLYAHLTYSGAKKYIQEFGGDISMFSKATRQAAAEQLRDQFEAEYLPEHPVDEAQVDGPIGSPVAQSEPSVDGPLGAPQDESAMSDMDLISQEVLQNLGPDASEEEVVSFLQQNHPDAVANAGLIMSGMQANAGAVDEQQVDGPIGSPAAQEVPPVDGPIGSVDEAEIDAAVAECMVDGPIGSPAAQSAPAVDGPVGAPVAEDGLDIAPIDANGVEGEVSVDPSLDGDIEGDGEEDVLAKPIEDEEHDEAEAAAIEEVGTKAEKAEAKIEAAEEAIETLKDAVAELSNLEGEEAPAGEGEALQDAGEDTPKAEGEDSEEGEEGEEKEDGDDDGEEGEDEEMEKIEELAKKKVGSHDFVAKPEIIKAKREATGKKPDGHVVKYVSAKHDPSKPANEQWYEEETPIPLTQAEAEKAEVDEEGKKKKDAGKKNSSDEYKKKDFEKGRPGTKMEEMTRFNGYRLGDKIKVPGHKTVFELSKITGNPVKFIVTEGKMSITLDALNDDFELEGDADIKWQRTSSIIEDTRAVWEDMEKDLIKEGCAGGVCSIGSPMSALNSTSGIGDVASAAPMFIRTPIHSFAKEVSAEQVYAYIKNNNLHMSPRGAAISHVMSNFMNPSIDVEKIYDDAVLSMKVSKETINEVDSSYKYEAASERGIDVDRTINEGYDALKKLGIV